MELTIEIIKQKLTNGHYLEDESIETDALKFCLSEIDRLVKIERAAKGFIWVTEGGGSCMGKQANYEALRAAINHKEG